MISIATLVNVVLVLLVGGVILGLLWWLIGYVESQNLAPPPVFKVIRVIYVVLVVVFLISILLHLSGYPVIRLNQV